MKNTSFTVKIIVFCLVLGITVSFTACVDHNSKGKSTLTTENSNTVSLYPEPSNFVTTSSSQTSSTPPTTSVPPIVTSDPPVTSNPPVIPPSNNIFDFGNENKLLEYIKNYYRGKSVHILMWRSFTDYEESVIKNFENSTGVKVKVTVTNEENYKSKLISLISQNNAPDVAMFSSKDFPNNAVTGALAPLKETLRYSTYDICMAADCWQKYYMNAYKINGDYFGVAMRGSWLCEDMNYVTYYNSEILKKCGVKKCHLKFIEMANGTGKPKKKLLKK